MKSEAAAKAREESQKLQQVINRQWIAFSKGSPEAYQDLLEYVESQREMYRQYAEERAMPHPNPNVGGMVPIDNATVAALLQNSRGVNIVKTYIVNRVNAHDVVPTKPK